MGLNQVPVHIVIGVAQVRQHSPAICEPPETVLRSRSPAGSSCLEAPQGSPDETSRRGCLLRKREAPIGCGDLRHEAHSGGRRVGNVINDVMASIFNIGVFLSLVLNRRSRVIGEGALPDVLGFGRDAPAG